MSSLTIQQPVILLAKESFFGKSPEELQFGVCELWGKSENKEEELAIVGKRGELRGAKITQQSM